MLISYPVEATAENWLHEGVVAILARALDGACNPMDDWLGVFPQEHRATLRRKYSLLGRLTRAVETIAVLDVRRQTSLRTCLFEQNRLPDAFSSMAIPPQVEAEPAELVDRLSELFECAFGLLSDLGIRDRQYEIVYSGVPAHVCGFCGLERLSAPVRHSPREHLDHYLAFSVYPLAGANLRNLAPIGNRCNSSHKRNADMLRGAAGAPRRCFDPYGDQQASVSLLSSRPLRGPRRGTDVLPLWEIELTGADADRIAVWDDVFDIRRRFRNDILDAEFAAWLDHFAVWAQDDPPTDLARLLECIRHYLHTVVQEGFGEAMFLRRATFEMLEHNLQIGPDSARVARWLLSLWDPDEGVVI